MRLAGSIELDGLLYYVVLEDTTGAQKWFLYSEIHPSRLAMTGSDRYIDSLNLNVLSQKACTDYIVESMVRSKKTGSSKTYLSSRQLDKIFRAFLDARDLSYPKSSILYNVDEFRPQRYRKFEALYNNYYISYEQTDGIYQNLSFQANDIKLDLREVSSLKLPRGLSYTDTTDKGNGLLDVVSINQIDASALDYVVDLSWYHDPVTKEVKKDYQDVFTFDDVESKVVTPMVREILRLRQLRKKALFSCDTETSGFNLLYLGDTNPDKDTISTIQFSWKDNQGVIIYLDMEYFDNVSKKYVVQRFGELFKYRPSWDSKFSFKLHKDENGNDIDETVILDRSWYLLTGHNVMFDSRVTMSEGCQFFFDRDTLQMAFNINPTTVKGSKGLKPLTRYFFHEETPELTDILGKGNEGKFRYLKDREIARIYGCADVDYSRKIYYELKKLMSKKMFNSYKQLDPFTWFLCAQSEYYGMRMNEEYVKLNSKRIKKDLHTLEELIYTYVGNVLAKRTSLVMSGVNPRDLTTSESLEEGELILDTKNRYEFKLGGKDVRNVMYNLLQYPVLVRSKKTGEPSVNSDAIKKLLYRQNKTSSNTLLQDIISADGESVLVSAKKFNYYKYPLCYLLQVYKTIDKEYNTYYAPFEKEDLEGRLFKKISTTNIETRRISCAAQIIKKSLKKAVISHNDDYYLADWDLNQVEARIFTSEAGDQAGIQKLRDFEKDYHTENAAGMFNILAHLVDKDRRKDAKSVGFGIPYGLSDFKLCERLHTVHTPENEIDTRLKRALFENANKKEMEYLNSVRQSALNIVNVPIELKRFWGLNDDAKVGLVKNKNGFYRYFNLDPVLGNPQKEASVARAAGNYPIQSFAADLFRVLLRRFYEALVKEGLEDKVIFHMYIHDELLFSVHKSIDPRRIAKICADSCMLSLKGHTNYFIGLNFGESWYECKKDENELPTGFLLEISDNLDKYKLQDWTDDPMALMTPLIADYKRRRSLEVIKEYEPNYKEKSLDIADLIDKFTNYTVRSYIYENGKGFEPRKIFNNQTGKEETSDDDLFLSCLCSLFEKVGEAEQMLLTPEGEYSVKDYVEMRSVESSMTDSTNFITDDYDEDEEDKLFGEDAFWSFDSTEDSDDFTSHVLNMYTEENNEEDVSLTVPKPKYKCLAELGKGVLVYLNKSRDMDKVTKFVNQFKSSIGVRIIIETPITSKSLVGKYNVNLQDLDNFLKKLNGSEKEVI